MNIAKTFRDLHISGDPFILANAWDIGSARMLAGLGAKALATTSAGFAFTQGLPDVEHLSRENSIAHGRKFVEATPLPVSADLENGYGHGPEDVATTIELAVEAGLAGCCIEDTMLPGDAPYRFSDAVARIEAGVFAAREAEKKHGVDFVLTARADGMMLGHYGLSEAILRLKAFEAAGADVLYAPVPPDMEALAEICRAVQKPVNALCVADFTKISVADFANIGVARISLGSTLARATHKIILDSARAMFERGDMRQLGQSASSDVVDALLKKYIS